MASVTSIATGLALVCSILMADGPTDPRGPMQTSLERHSPLRFEVRLNPSLAGRGSKPSLSGRLLVVIGKPDQGEPRLHVGQTGLKQAPVLACDAIDFEPGGVKVLDSNSAIFPIEHLDRLPAGTYSAQAILHINRDLNFLNAPGDLHSSPRTFQYDGTHPQVVSLELDQRLAEESLPHDTDQVRYVKVRSKKLSEFHGRPIDLRAGVILPRDYNRESDRRYPLRIHIGGYGSRFTRVGAMMRPEATFQKEWNAAEAPRMVLLHLDGAGPFGDPYQVNSDNHGPYGDAITRELIPHVESQFRCIGKGTARALDGGSTGGWVALALQIFYPTFFNGAWASCPDSVDFRDVELVNIYEDENAYVNRHGFERPAARETSGEVRYTMRHELALENLMGLGNSWTMSGGQWGAWNATYSPRGADGRPAPAWDPKTGKIDRRVTESWRRYDLRHILETQWTTLGPRLRGKLHIQVGDADDYFLNNAVRRLEAFLSHAEPGYEGSIQYGAGQGHCWSGWKQGELMKRIEKRVAPPESTREVSRNTRD